MVLIFLLLSILQALSPSSVKGNLITIFLDIFDSIFASAIIPLHSMAVTSALIGPFIILEISLSIFLKSFPDLATNDGLVVIPLIKPVSLSSLITSTSAVSKKNSITNNILTDIFIS